MIDLEVRPRVVMIDDEPDFLALVGSWLEPKYSFLGMTSGEELMARIQALDPCAFILDVCMPGMDGFELCKLIRKDARLRDVPIIFLTGNHTEKDFFRHLQAGANVYLTKPVERRFLLKMLNDEVWGPSEHVDIAAAD